MRASSVANSSARSASEAAGVRTFVFLAAMVLIAVLGFLTVYVLFTSGPDVIVVVSLIIVGLLGFGVFGAFLRPPDDD
jgi:hypothetical protein